MCIRDSRTNTRPFGVLHRDHHRHVVMEDADGHVFLRLTADRPLRDFKDPTRTMVRVDHLVPHLEHTALLRTHHPYLSSRLSSRSLKNPSFMSWARAWLTPSTWASSSVDALMISSRLENLATKLVMTPLGNRGILRNMR